jgi:transposase InsO family protein
LPATIWRDNHPIQAQPNHHPDCRAITTQIVALQPTQAADRWSWYDQQPETRKKRAAIRLEAIAKVEALTPELGASGAVAMAAREFNVSPSTIWAWKSLTGGVARSDRLPAVTPLARGGAKPVAAVSDEAWNMLRADYLRLAQPSFESCYRRLVEAAKEKGWTLPSRSTLKRRLAAIPLQVNVMARQGQDAAKKMFPAQERDRSIFEAMEAVNTDGHKWDVFVRWPDGTVGRPLTIAFQDLYSGMILCWRHDRSENKDTIRLAFGDMITKFGIPDHCYLDNGRAFASKWLTGRTKNRYRFKIRDDEPLGIITLLGVNIHWTTPYAGQSKPIERSFGDFARDIAKHPAFQGAYCGNSPMAKPEDYGTKAVPFDEFDRIVGDEIAKWNCRSGRKSKTAAGRSFLETFRESYEQALIRRPSLEQQRLCLLAAESVQVRRQDGTLHLFGNRFWHEALMAHRGEKVTMRFDPQNLKQDLAIFLQDGTYLCDAKLIEAVGFNDTDAARAHAQNRGAFLKATKAALSAERKMGLAEVTALTARAEKAEGDQMPEPKVLRPVFGNLALRPKPAVEPGLSAEVSDFDEKYLRAMGRLRAVPTDGS